MSRRDDAWAFETVEDRRAALPPCYHGGKLAEYHGDTFPGMATRSQVGQAGGVMGVEHGPTFGVLLRRYRKTAGLTQEQLAERAYLSPFTISALERGANPTPRPDTVDLLAQALELGVLERGLLVGAARAGTRRTAPADALAGQPPLVGRTEELALLERHLAGQGPPALLLAGEPGIGKSRLLREAARLATARGWTVLQGGGQRGGEQEPYAPLIEALKRHIQAQPPAELRIHLRGCAWLARLLPELAAGPIEPLPPWSLAPAQERRLMVEAVGRFLANVAGPAGTLLALDDLQWASPDALDLVMTLLRSTPITPLRVVGAYRSTELRADHPAAAPLADLAQAGLAAQRRLGPLTPHEADELLDHVLEGITAQDMAPRERVLQRAGGLPFFLTSWARSLRQGELAGDRAESVPWDVAQSIRRRVALLPDAVLALLRAAAVIGRHVRRALLTSVLAWPEEQVVTALEAACEAGLLSEEGHTGYQFVHDVILDVVEADLSAARRAVLHQRVAEALEREPAGAPDLLAYHYARSDARDKAALYLEQAADQARAHYATATAESYYREAIARLRDLGRAQDAARASEKLGAVLRTVARYGDALTVLERAAETYRAGGDLEGVGRVVAQMGWIHADAGMAAEGMALLEPVLEQIEARGPSPSLAVLYAALAHLFYFSGRYTDQLAAAERARQLAELVGDDSTMVEALYGRGLALYAIGRRAEALPAFEATIPLAEATGNYYCFCYAYLLAADLYDERGEFAVSRRYTEHALHLAERHGDRATIASVVTGHGMSAFYTGEWEAARRDYEQAVAMSRAVGDFWGSVYPLLDLGRLALAQGAWEQAALYLQECERIVRSSADRNARDEVESVLAERDLLQGRPEAAQARLVPLLDQHGRREKSLPFLLPRMAWALLELGEVEQAARMAGQAVAASRMEEHRLFLVDALRVQAMILARQERWEQAERALEEGLALAQAMRYPYAQARLHYVYGVMQWQRGELEAAREQLREALALFQWLGARKDAERVCQSPFLAGDDLT